jgi:S1-C subfamily serine protease
VTFGVERATRFCRRVQATSTASRRRTGRSPSFREGDEVGLQIQRDGKGRKVKVKLTPHPEDDDE